MYVYIAYVPLVPLDDKNQEIIEGNAEQPKSVQEPEYVR